MSQICGSYYELRENLDRALIELYIDAEVAYRTISYDDAVRLDIKGSPTILDQREGRLRRTQLARHYLTDLSGRVRETQERSFRHHIEASDSTGDEHSIGRCAGSTGFSAPFFVLHARWFCLIMPKSIVFIGDSLTEWFDWQRRFPEYAVSNLGISGEPVEGLLARRELIRGAIENPDYLFLMTGINNIAMEQYDFFGPYREIVRDLTTWYRKSTVVVQSILPVSLEWISNEVIKDANLRLEQIAHEYHADYLDVYRFFVDSQGMPKSGYLQDDGVHLSSTGYDIWANTVESFLQKAAHA